MNLQVEQMHPLVLNVGLAVHNADWNWKNVNSPFTRLYYVTEGSAQIELPDGIYTLSPKHMYFIPAFTIHTNICKSNFVHYYLHIYEDHYSDNDWLDHWKFPVEIEATDLDLALFKRLCEINPHMTLQKSDPTTYDNNPTLMQNLIKNRQRAFCDKVESRGIVFQLLSRFFKQGQSKIEMEDNRIAKTVLYIRKHLNEAIELEKLANEPPNDDELQGAKENISGRIKYFTQNNAQIASVYGYNYIMELGLDYNDKFIQEINKVNSNDVSSVARRLLNSSKLTVVIGPDKFKPDNF